MERPSATFGNGKLNDFIVIRNGKIVWKVVWIEYYLRLNLSSRRYYNQATSEFIKCKHLMCRNISPFYYSDINLFLVDYAFCQLCNIWLLLFENNSRSYHYTGASHWRKNTAAVITQAR